MNLKLRKNFPKGFLKTGVYAVGFFYPVVAEGEARIRTQISLHTKNQLEQALRIFQKVKSELGYRNASRQSFEQLLIIE